LIALVNNGNENICIACATDDAIVFKIRRRNSNRKCDKRIYRWGNTRINIYLYDGYPGKRVFVLGLQKKKKKKKFFFLYYI